MYIGTIRDGSATTRSIDEQTIYAECETQLILNKFTTAFVEMIKFR